MQRLCCDGALQQPRVRLAKRAHSATAPEPRFKVALCLRCLFGNYLFFAFDIIIGQLLELGLRYRE